MKIIWKTFLLLLMIVGISHGNNGNTDEEPVDDPSPNDVQEDGSDVVRNNTNEEQAQRDPRNNAMFPPYEFKINKKTSGKEVLTLIVNCQYRFLKRKFFKNTFYFECNYPQCTAKSQAIGPKEDKNPQVTRIDTIHRLANGSALWEYKVRTYMLLTGASDWPRSAENEFAKQTPPWRAVRETNECLRGEWSPINKTCSINGTVVNTTMDNPMDHFHMAVPLDLIYSWDPSLMQDPPMVGASALDTPDKLGCAYEWCKHIPKVTVAQFMVGFFIATTGYPFCIAIMGSLYSKSLGSIPQGFWLSLLTGSGSLARVVGPIFVTLIYENYGTYLTFSLVTGSLVLSGGLILIAYKQLGNIPQGKKTEDSSSSSETAEGRQSPIAPMPMPDPMPKPESPPTYEETVKEN